MGDEPITVADDPDAPGWARLELRGRITIEKAQALYQTARTLATHPAGVTLSCADSEHLDCAALQILACLRRELLARGRAFRVTGAAGRVAGLVALAGLVDDRGARTRG